MKKTKILAFLLAAVMLLTLCACGAQTSATQTSAPSRTEAQKEDYEVTDLLGRTVTIPTETSSYVCIGPGALRLYCYVADKTQLAGVEDVEASWGNDGRSYAMSFENMADYKVIGPGGPGNAPDAELLVSAAPDVIFTMYNSDISAVDELQNKTGIPIVALSYGDDTIFNNGIYDSLTLIGKITSHKDRASEVVNYLKNIQSDLQTRTADVTSRPTVYLGAQSSKGAHGIESTTGNYALFNSINADNVVDDAGISDYVMLDKEKLLDMDPDVIILDAGGLSIVQDDYKSNPDYYNSLSAVKNGKVYLQMPFNYYYTNIEIALADAYYIGSVLYAKQFSDVDPTAKFDEISNQLLGISTYEQISSEYYGGYQQVNLGS
mgnify:FL=1